MPVTTRNGRSSTPKAPAQLEQHEQAYSEPLPSRNISSRPSPYLLLVYLIILAAGSLYSVISPAALPPSPAIAPLAAGIASDANSPVHHPHTVSYFAGKHNLINLYFVKIGWFWTTLAFALLQVITTRPASKPSHYVQAATRYALVTLAWILTTQWMFGPALIDRSFTVTGGHCEAQSISDKRSFNPAVDISSVASGPACKAAGGRWRGGHDISGHVFMLVLSSAFLLFELYLADRHSSHPSISPRAAAAVAAGMTEDEKRAVGGWESETVANLRIWSRYLVWTVVALDVWMLLMTAIWFHTWPEKLSGLLLSASTLWSIYFLPDFVPVWRAIVGSL